jgi:tetratricopeptide (TPR) repeat protein
LSFERRQIAKQIKGIYDYINRAMEISPNDPFVLTMQGNVEFFNPFFGSKQKALKYYQKADSIYKQHANQYNYPRWNIRALQIPLLQSMEKLGYIEDAIQKCDEILARDPYFPFITELYLPSLLKKKKINRE